MLNSKRKPNIQTINMVIIANSNEIQEEVKVMFIGSFKSMLRIKYARILWQSIPIVTGWSHGNDKKILPVMHRTQPPRDDHAVLPFFLKK